MRDSRKLYTPVYAMILIIISILIMMKVNDIPISRIAYFSSIIFMILGIKTTEIHRLNNKYEINPFSLVHTMGYFNKISKRLDLHSISDIALSQNFWQRLLGYGNVSVSIFASEGSTVVKNINNPNEFIAILEEKINLAKKGGK